MLRIIITLAVLTLTPAATNQPTPESGPLKLVPVVSPTGERLYWVNCDNVPCRDMMAEIERATGLMYLAKDVPEVRVTLKAEKVSVKELFERVNNLMEPHNWMLRRGKQSFSSVPLDYKPGGKPIHITLDGLSKEPRSQAVVLTVSVDAKGAEAGVELARTMEKTWLEVTTFGNDKLLVQGLGRDVQEFVNKMGDHIKKEPTEAAERRWGVIWSGSPK